MNPILIAAAVAIDIPLFWGIYKLFFRDLDELFEVIGYVITPDFWSFLKGEFGADFFAELKFGLFMFILGAIVFTEFALIQSLAPPV
jgi:hypothetical protein